MNLKIETRWCALAAALALSACASKEKPDAMVYAAVEAANGKPQALWTSLPASYQADVKGLVVAFADKMDPKLWDDGFSLAKKTVKVAQDQKALILQLPQLKALELKPESYDAVVKIVATIVNSEIGTVAGLKALDIEKFLGGTVAGLMNDIITAAQTASAATQGPDVGSTLTKIKNVKTAVMSIEGNKAKVKIEMEGEPAREQEFVKVEDKWVPKDLADAWAPMVQKAKEGIAAIKLEPEMVSSMQLAKPALDGALDKLLAAKTADEFNAVIGQTAQSLPGLGKGPSTVAENTAAGDPAAASAAGDDNATAGKKGKLAKNAKAKGKGKKGKKARP